MNVFIIHENDDIEYARFFGHILHTKTKSEVLVMEKEGFLPWKLYARCLLNKAQMVVVIVGNTTSKNENVKWEIKRALKYNKIIYCLDIKKYEKLRNSIKYYKNAKIKEAINNKNTKKYIENIYPKYEKILNKQRKKFDKYEQPDALK